MNAPQRKNSLLYRLHPHYIGLSEAAPQVAGTVAAADIATSETGYFLAELEGLNLKVVEASRDTADGNLHQLMFNARRDALNELDVDLMAGLASVYGQPRTKYSSIIGDGGHVGVLDVPDGTLVKLELFPVPNTGASLLIKRIGLLLAADANVTVQIAHPAIETQSFEVVSTADTPSYVTPATPVLIPLADTRPVVVSYTVNGFLPRSNSTSCGCTAMDSRLADYFTNALKMPAKGILLDVTVGVHEESQVLENNLQGSDVIARVMALASRYKAGELLIQKIIDSTTISRFTMLDVKELYGKRNHFRKEYQDRINYLVSRDSIDVSLGGGWTILPTPTTSMKLIGL